jgi:hypothetical protein
MIGKQHIIMIGNFKSEKISKLILTICHILQYKIIEDQLNTDLTELEAAIQESKWTEVKRLNKDIIEQLALLLVVPFDEERKNALSDKAKGAVEDANVRSDFLITFDT